MWYARARLAGSSVECRVTKRSGDGRSGARGICGQGMSLFAFFCWSGDSGGKGLFFMHMNVTWVVGEVTDKADDGRRAERMNVFFSFFIVLEIEGGDGPNM
jgi:hypothetical protein